MNCVSHVAYVLILRSTFSTHNMCMTSCSCLLLAITLQIVTDLGFVYTAVVLHSDTMGVEKKCIFFKKHFVFFSISIPILLFSPTLRIFVIKYVMKIKK